MARTELSLSDNKHTKSRILNVFRNIETVKIEKSKEKILSGYVL